MIRTEIRRAIDTYGDNGGIIIGVPSVAAMFLDVQNIIVDELEKYGKKFTAEHFPK